jgi:hypothetical protein
VTILLELLGRRHRGNTFWVEIFIKQGFCQLETKLVFTCLILELNLIGLESVDVVLVDIETEQDDTRPLCQGQ